MIDEEKLRHQMQRIADLVQRVDTAPDAGLKTQAKELMEAVMDLHGEAMERVLAAVRHAGDSGRQILDALSADPVISSVLLLYGLHPLDFETRVRGAMERITARLRSQGVRVESVALNDGAIRILIRGVDHSFTARSVKSLIEEEIYAAAPDSASLVIDGLEKFAPADFVPLEKIGVLSAGKAGD